MEQIYNKFLRENQNDKIIKKSGNVIITKDRIDAYVVSVYSSKDRKWSTINITGSKEKAIMYFNKVKQSLIYNKGLKLVKEKPNKNKDMIEKINQIL